jgi:hypothetical protein
LEFATGAKTSTRPADGQIALRKAQSIAPACRSRGNHGRSGVRQKTHFTSRLKQITPVQSTREKHFSFALSEVVIVYHRPVSIRGALRDRHER